MSMTDIITAFLTTLTLSPDAPADVPDVLVADQPAAHIEEDTGIVPILLCQIDQGTLQGARSFEAVLTAHGGPVSGSFEYVLTQKGSSSIRLKRSGDFDLNTDESIALGIHAVAGKGGLPNLDVIVDGTPLDCALAAGV